ncbi:MAG: hypothetical protein JXA21_07040 [Anaerolineae bacterium]|nr:hypothetical protein [Anaerolineae bacterium]
MNPYIKAALGSLSIAGLVRLVLLYGDDAAAQWVNAAALLIGWWVLRDIGGTDMLQRKLARMVSIVFVILALVVILTACDQTGRKIELAMYEAQLEQAKTQRAEVETELQQVRLETEQARAELERAKGERAIMESAARSVDADRQLVTWYAMRGDVRGLLFLAILIGSGLGIVLAEYLKKAQDGKRRKNKTVNDLGQ